MSPQPFGKVSIEEVISEDPALVRLIYQYLAWAAFWLVAASAISLVLSIKACEAELATDRVAGR